MEEWIVAASETNEKLIAFLAAKLSSNMSRRSIKEQVEKGACSVNGKREQFASSRLAAGDKVHFSSRSVHVKRSVEFEMSRVIHEDDALIIYNKPPGISCDKSGMIQLLHSKDSTLRLMHRLDKETTGLLIFVKSEETFQHLFAQFKAREIKKQYIALVHGCIKEGQGRLVNQYGKLCELEGQSIWGAVGTGGVEAITDWEKIASNRHYSLLYCYPQTGRTHQIRSHLASMGHPIVGDLQYRQSTYSRIPQGVNRYLLHAAAIEFIHPATSQIASFFAPLPKDYQAVLRNENLNY